jgi:osmotically-inducible protein OsmY
MNKALLKGVMLLALTNLGLCGVALAEEPAGAGKPAAQAQHAPTDAEITAKVKSLYQRSLVIPYLDINVKTVDHGVVILTGRVPNQGVADYAAAVAHGVEGVRDVVPRFLVDPRMEKKTPATEGKGQK